MRKFDLLLRSSRSDDFGNIRDQLTILKTNAAWDEEKRLNMLRTLVKE